MDNFGLYPFRKNNNRSNSTKCLFAMDDPVYLSVSAEPHFSRHCMQIDLIELFFFSFRRLLEALLILIK